jgi:hypothetical protein
LNVITHARVAGGLCVLVFLIGVVSVVAGTRGARLADIQLGTDPRQVQQLVGDSSVRSAANRAIAIDYFFLAAYWAAFVALAALLARRGGLWLVVAVLAAATATTAATLDIVENMRTTDVLAFYQPGDQLLQKQLDALRHVSLLKWGAAATTVTLLAGVFAQRDKIAVTAVLLLVIAGIGFAGIDRHGLIQVYLLGVGVMSIVIGALLLAWPRAVTGRL